MKKKAVVLLSGGIDSTTCLAMAIDKYRPCGTCATCIDRAKAFQANGISVPALNNN